MTASAGSINRDCRRPAIFRLFRPGGLLQIPLFPQSVMIPDLDRAYRPARGFTFRRESFGGILYHYEGTRPDPRVTFVDSPFVVDLLRMFSEHPDITPAALIRQASERFQLTGASLSALEEFFLTLIQRGALEPASPEEQHSKAEEASHA